MKLKKGFTILELLVASLLLGMLMTVLTMIFNQSSISWRVGKASISDLDEVSDGISSIHDVADNVYLWDGKPYLLTSIWEVKNRQNGRWFRETRPLALADGSGNDLANLDDEGRGKGSSSFVPMFRNVGNRIKVKKIPGSWDTESVGQGERGSAETLYTINVKSAGPNRKFGDYDDIWSFPDEFDL